MESQGRNENLNRYFHDISQTPRLTPDEELDLAVKIKNGDEKALEHMIRSNLRLVVKIAQGFSHCGVPLLDLISEGNMGLMKAAKRFDAEKGAKFSTYAIWWIKQAIKRGLAYQSKTVRLPMHMVDKIAKMRRIETSLTIELGRDPTDEEVSDATGISERRVHMVRHAVMRPTSIDAPINVGESSTFGEVMADQNATDPAEAFSDKNIFSHIVELLSILTPREKVIIEHRFGLNESQTTMTLEAISEKFHLTRERIRQLEKNALEKMSQKFRRIETACELFQSKPPQAKNSLKQTHGSTEET